MSIIPFIAWGFYALLIGVEIVMIFVTASYGTTCTLHPYLWLYVKGGTSIAFYIAIFPFCLLFFMFYYTNNKQDFHPWIFRPSMIVSGILSVFFVAWGGYGINLVVNHCTERTFFENVIFGISIFNIIFYTLGFIFLLVMLLVELSSD